MPVTESKLHNKNTQCDPQCKPYPSKQLLIFDLTKQKLENRIATHFIKLAVLRKITDKFLQLRKAMSLFLFFFYIVEVKINIFAIVGMICCKFPAQVDGYPVFPAAYLTTPATAAG